MSGAFSRPERQVRILPRALAANARPAKCHVWTAPSWQVKTSRRSIGRCSHVFGLLMRFA